MYLPLHDARCPICGGRIPNSGCVHDPRPVIPGDWWETCTFPPEPPCRCGRPVWLTGPLLH